MADRPLSPGCTFLDHIYPATQPGMPCYCGKRTWADAPRMTRALKVGTCVRVRGGECRIVIAKIRGEDAYRIDLPVGGWSTFERSELDVVVERTPQDRGQ